MLCRLCSINHLHFFFCSLWWMKHCPIDGFTFKKHGGAAEFKFFWSYFFSWLKCSWMLLFSGSVDTISLSCLECIFNKSESNIPATLPDFNAAMPFDSGNQTDLCLSAWPVMGQKSYRSFSSWLNGRWDLGLPFCLWAHRTAAHMPSLWGCNDGQEKGASELWETKHNLIVINHRMVVLRGTLEII